MLTTLAVIGLGSIFVGAAGIVICAPVPWFIRCLFGGVLLCAIVGLVGAIQRRM